MTDVIGARSIASATGTGRTAMVVALAAVLGVGFRSEVLVPGSDTVASIWPLFSSSGVLVASAVCTLRGRWMEGAAGRSRPLALSAGCGFLLVAMSASLGCGVLLLAVGADAGELPARGAEVVRNLAIVSGVTVLLSRVVGNDVAWCPALCWVAGSWLAGSRPRGVPPASWAWLLQPASHRGAAVATAMLVVTGSWLVVRPGSSPRWGRTA